MNSIFKRRSIRKYEEKSVENEKIHLLLKAAMSAPTARNQREWEFVVVTDPEILRELSQASPYAKPTAAAPLAIVPLANTERMNGTAYLEQDLGAAVENILIEAEELSLGAVWMGIMPREERMARVSEVLKLPEHVVPFAIVAVGYPAEVREAGERYEEERVHYNGY